MAPVGFSTLETRTCIAVHHLDEASAPGLGKVEEGATDLLHVQLAAEPLVKQRLPTAAAGQWQPTAAGQRQRTAGGQRQRTAAGQRQPRVPESADRLLKWR